nr:cytochrome b6/f complex subunit VI [Cephaleuros karstenii]UIB39088.1 cytochrome b6/f complex subunit VI [Cephaleuros karstenii]
MLYFLFYIIFLIGLLVFAGVTYLALKKIKLI